MGDQDKRIAAYITLQQISMDLCFILMMCFTMIYRFVESFQQEQEEEEEEALSADNVMGDGPDTDPDSDTDSHASSLTHNPIAISSKERASQRRRRVRQKFNLQVDEMTKLIVTLLEMGNKLDILTRGFCSGHDVRERRQKVNGELMKLPDLSVRDRLRVATILVAETHYIDLLSYIPEDQKPLLVRHLLDRSQKS